MLWVVCTMCVMAVGVVAQDEEMPLVWHVGNYPSPYDPTETRCMREDRKTSVCDPNGILSVEQANQLDRDIEELMSQTECPCSAESCRRDRAGYRVSVALMQQMHDPLNGKRSEEDQVEWSLDNAHVFAHVLLNKWAAGQCKEDLLILYSQNDNVIYTVTNEVSRRTLPNTRVGEITARVRYNFSKGRDIYLGFKEMLKMYRQVFNGRYKDYYDIEVNKPLDPQAQIGGGQTKHTLYAPLLLASLSVILLLIGY